MEDGQVLLYFPLHGRVPVVLDGVVRAAGQHLRDVCPLVAVHPVSEQDGSILLL